jgi:carboxyl-terminal processing protease
VNLTGLFVKRGPVVQAKDGSGVVRVNKCHDAVVAYDGPMMVLTNRLSASASEIFAAALQDYGRALIVGDQSTFGKGTVQTMIPVGHQWPIAGGADAGALKLTIQKFYRIAGGSTQLKGVEPDVKLPSLYDLAQIGESSLKNPLPYDTVDKVPYDKWEKPLFKPELAKRSAARIAADPEFSYINEDLDRTKQRLAENRISLNEKARVAELDEDKVRQEKRTAERAKITVPEQKDYIVTLENLNKPELELAKSEAKDENGDSTKVEADELDPTDPDGEDAEGNPKKPAIDPVRNEALNIIADLVDLSKSPKPSTTTAAK